MHRLLRLVPCRRPPCHPWAIWGCEKSHLCRQQVAILDLVLALGNAGLIAFLDCLRLSSSIASLFGARKPIFPLVLAAHEPAGGMQSWDLENSALVFYDENCVNCTHRQPVRLPNLTKLVAEREERRRIRKFE